LAFFEKLLPCLEGIEACASHHWSRELQMLGHAVRLMPPAYVKPYVKRQKNDTTEAEAICEAVARPNMRFVPTKTVEQQTCLEELLKSRFPTDSIEPVGKGELGADVIQQVNSQVGQPAGIILWETSAPRPGAMDGWPSCAMTNAAPAPISHSSFPMLCPSISNTSISLTAYGLLTRSAPCR
jgi:hypothetical protein